MRFAVIIALLCSTLHAATYYVKNGGNDANPGTEGSPWASCPGLASWTGMGTITAGDTVYFDNASTWTESSTDHILDVTGGVTFDGATWGIGTRATLKGSAQLTNDNSGVVVIDQDHVTFETVVKGFEIDGQVADCAGVRFLPQNGTQGSLTGAIKRIENCYIHDSGSTDDNWSYGIIVSPSSTLAKRTCSNVEILNNVVEDSRRVGIAIYANTSAFDHEITNVVVRGNTVTRSGLSTTSVASGIMVRNAADTVTIEFNYVHNNYAQDGFVGAAAPGIYIYDPNGSDQSGCSGIVIRYNLVTNNGSNDSEGSLAAIQCLQNVLDAEIYGNIIWANEGSGIGLSGDHTQAVDSNYKVYNNTLYANCTQSNYTEAEIAFSTTDWTSATCEIKNNIIYADPQAGTGARICLFDDPATIGNRITAHSNNVYYRVGAGNLVRMDATSYTSGTIAGWEATAQTADPLFLNVANPPSGFAGTYGSNMIPNATGFSLNSISTAVEGGSTLTAPYDGAINLSGRGITRPVAFDIGAWETYGTTLTTGTITIGP